MKNKIDLGNWKVNIKKNVEQQGFSLTANLPDLMATQNTKLFVGDEEIIEAKKVSPYLESQIDRLIESHNDQLFKFLAKSFEGSTMVEVNGKKHVITIAEITSE